MKQYRVLAQSDTFWRDRFDAAALEEGLNRLAREGWRVVAITTSEHWGIGGGGIRRGELCVVLERDAPPAPPPMPVGEYDATKIPVDRYYVAVGGDLGHVLQEAGLADHRALALARQELAKRGGHLCDHLLALGVVEDDRLRQLFRGLYEVG